MNNLSTVARGASAEMLVALDLIEAGCSVFRPIHHDARYDLIAEVDGRLVRVQVKRASGQSLTVNLAKYTKLRDEYGSFTRVTPRYREGDFDVLAIADMKGRDVFYVRAEDVDLAKTNFTLKAGDRERSRGIRSVLGLAPQGSRSAA